MMYVIMSVYRGDTLLALQDAVNSILSQSFADFRLCIICDGPVTDEIAAYLTAMEDKRVRVKVRDENRGLAVSLNELLADVLQQEDCDYIARMDADDYSLPERFRVQRDFLVAHPEVDIVGCFIRESGDPVQEGGSPVTYPEDHEGCRMIFGKRNPVAHPTVMFRKSFFDKAGLYPTDTLRGEDSALWLKGFKAGCRFANIPQVLVRMRVGTAFYERRNSAEKTKQDYRFRNRIIRELDLPKTNYLYSLARYLLSAIRLPLCSSLPIVICAPDPLLPLRSFAAEGCGARMTAERKW